MLHIQVSELNQMARHVPGEEMQPPTPTVPTPEADRNELTHTCAATCALQGDVVTTAKIVEMSSEDIGVKYSLPTLL